jgi:Ca-activated chloride channel family protein
MVFVMWKSRYQAFLARCPEVSLKTIDFAMQTKAGWAQIAAKPQWGRFKFSHTHPNQSNSGLMTLLLMSYEYFHKTSDLSVRDIMTEGFQDHLEGFERGVTGMSDSTGGLTKLLSHSTGDLMKEMVLEGPSRYDALLVYESVAIDYLGSAEGRWEPLQVIYPPCNLWSENPYYVLNTPWTTPAHQKAAEAFLKFLMSEPAQAKALEHGFRPGNPALPIKRPDSPFVRYAANGLSIEVSSICEVPAPEVIDNLLESWIRNTAPAAR